MKLITSIALLLAQGATLQIKFSQPSEGKVQLDILPAGKENKAGILIPPKSIIGTAEELDAELEKFMEAYCSSASRIASTASNVEAEMKKLEDEASAAAKKALEDKRANKKPGSGTTTKPSIPAGKKAPSLGLPDDDDEQDEGTATEGGDEDSGHTALDTSSAPAQSPTPAPAAAPAVPALTVDLF